MSVFRSYPNILCPAKVNLILRVGPRLSSGYHKIETLMTQVKWGDLLSLRVRSAKETRIDLQTPGLKLSPKKNLVYRAAVTFAEKFKSPLEAKILLKKNVPTGAGLGGGSSDAAKVLELLFNWKFKSRTRYPQEWRQLTKIAAELGSDIPFFLALPSAWCTGFGEKIEPVKLPKLWIVIVLPKVKVPTPWAYKELDRIRGSASQSLNGKPVWLFDDDYSIPVLENDFESIVVSAKPSLKRMRKLLAQSHAQAALMSGSGSSFFGLYSNQRAASQAAKFFTRQGIRAIATASA